MAFAFKASLGLRPPIRVTCISNEAAKTNSLHLSDQKSTQLPSLEINSVSNYLSVLYKLDGFGFQEQIVKLLCVIELRKACIRFS